MIDSRDFKSAFEAMYHGKYDFEDFKSGEVSSKYKSLLSGKRKVYEAGADLKVYHKFLNLFVFQWLEVNERCVYSYRKGVNVVDAVKKHSNSKHFFQTDLNDFFGSLSRRLVKECIFQGLDRVPISDVEKYIDRIVTLVTVQDKLPMGFSTSPAISNACLLPLDDAMEKYCDDRGLVYTRYSDDIIISGTDSKLYGIESIVEKALEDFFGKNITLNLAKTKFSSVGNKLKILGMMILPNGTITIDKRLKSDIEVLLYFYINDKQKFLDKVNVEGSAAALTKVSGYLNYINTVDKVYLDKLRKKYGSSVIDMFIRGSVKSL